jgi:hypothetical protein
MRLESSNSHWPGTIDVNHERGVTNGGSTTYTN